MRRSRRGVELEGTEEGVEDGVADAIGDLVRVSFRDGFGREEKVTLVAHSVSNRSVRLGEWGAEVRRLGRLNGRKGPGGQVLG